jgi:DNA primase
LLYNVGVPEQLFVPHRWSSRIRPLAPGGIARISGESVPMNEVEEVKTRLDIVDVIGQYVQLQKAGRTMKAVCPFHAEKTPSFIVSPERQSWHCFGACGTGGDVISFVMKKEAIEFPEALKMLAERAGVRLQERRRSDQEDRRQQRLYAANDAAAGWYSDLLRNFDGARHARSYLEGRGIDEAAGATFGVGFSSPGWEGLRDHLRERGFSDEELLRAGLLVQGERGVHDRFRGRLMFPIHDEKGRTAGFGARALDDSHPKYINTSQTPIYDKSGLLYALHKALPTIRKDGRAVIVEGYMDVIAAHQHGHENVVASMGTALTERQVRLLRRSAQEIVLALDADAAGRDAAIRGHDVIREAVRDSGASVPVVTWRGLVGYQQGQGVELKVAVLPQGRDPDDVIRADPAKWGELVEHAVPVLDFRLDALAQSRDLTNPNGRAALVQDFLPILSVVTDPVVKAHYVQRLGRISGTAERELSVMLSQKREMRRVNSATEAPSVVVEPTGDAREEFLLALLIRYPQLRDESGAISEDLLWGSEARAILLAWRELPLENDADQKNMLLERLPVELAPYVERLFLRRMPDYDRKEAQKALEDCLARLERRRLEMQKQASASLLAEREAEVGASPLAEASGHEEISDERLLELASVHVQDMRIGLKLHGKEVEDSDNGVETRNNG